MEKTILVVSANPKGTPELDIVKEVNSIKEGLGRRSNNSEEFDVKTIESTTYDDLRQNLLNLKQKPTIVHFCGHGAGEQGLVLQDNESNPDFVSTEALSDLFRILSKQEDNKIECVILNACFAEVQAKEISKHINYVIGMKDAIPDDLAIEFTKGFYEGLNAGYSIDTAFEVGQNCIIKKVFKQPERYREFILDEPSETAPKTKLRAHLIPKLHKNSHPVAFPRLTPSQAAGKGLSALKDLMSNPQVYAEVKAGKDKLQEACNQIKIISTYKSVHDELHNLEFECYQPIIDEERWFSDNTKMSLRNLRSYYSNLQRINGNLQETAQRKIENQPILQETDWLQDLKQAQAGLYEFIEISNEIADFCKLQPTINLLNSVLAYQPTVMDTNLNNAAKALSLASLVQSMCIIRDDIDQVKPISEQESKKIRYIQEGVKALEDLLQEYASLVIRHNEWQRIELDLRCIQSNLNQNINTLEWALSRLKTRIEKQYSDCGDEWMEEMNQLKKYEDKLNNALTMKAEISEVKEDFQAWRRQASYCFFILDKELNSFCGQLRDYIDKPLEAIIEMMTS
ncbi:MAG TPA: CHAT domain-containing protein [Bacteroidales bacterium]|nr:CHAT domain-containing protein [Bacteroidales bacterium]